MYKAPRLKVKSDVELLMCFPSHQFRNNDRKIIHVLHWIILGKIIFSLYHYNSKSANKKKKKSCPSPRKWQTFCLIITCNIDCTIPILYCVHRENVVITRPHTIACWRRESARFGVCATSFSRWTEWITVTVFHNRQHVAKPNSPNDCPSGSLPAPVRTHKPDSRKASAKTWRT